VRLYKEMEAFARDVPRGARLLDAGAGSGPYKQLFTHARYESADFERINKGYQENTYICDLASIPVEDNCFDFIIFNQVMEHLPEPQLVLVELRRILKRGGKLLYTGPLFYEEHEQPYDFYRYTKYGVRYLLEKSGFRVDKIEWLEGYLGSSAYQLHTMSQYLPYKPISGPGAYVLLPFMAFLKSAFLVTSILFHRLEIVSKYTARGFPKNYIAVACKP
jgi:SAM-dependent methyltransferase